MYTGHALDIVGCITIGDITIDLAWWVPFMGQKSLCFKKTLVFVQRINTCFNSSFLDFDHA